MINALAWQLEHGEHLDQYETLADLGQSTPLDDAPEINSGTHAYLSAFGLLSSGRPSGMAPGPIPLAEIVTYWREVCALDDLPDFIDIVRGMDAAWLEWARERAKSQRDAMHH